MENNLENKQKFFALYWGQKVFINELLSDKPVQNIFIKNLASEEDSTSYFEYLLLRPLSKLRTEDAEELGRIWMRNPTGNFTDQCDDYLRSKGYAQAWMGISVEQMVDWGWIALDEEPSQDLPN